MHEGDGREFGYCEPRKDADAMRHGCAPTDRRHEADLHIESTRVIEPGIASADIEGRAEGLAGQADWRCDED